MRRGSFPGTPARTERICDHLASHDATSGAARIAEIVQAIAVLVHNPLIGRPVRGQNGELITGRRASGYVVLHRYAETVDTVFVLAVRGQREAGCIGHTP